MIFVALLEFTAPPHATMKPNVTLLFLVATYLTITSAIVLAAPPETLPRIKITGRQMDVRQTEVHPGSRVHVRPPPSLGLQFEYWLLDDSFICRREFSVLERVAPPPSNLPLFAIRFSNPDTNTAVTTRTRTSVISYQTNLDRTLDDFPVQYFQTGFKPDDGPQISSMSAIDAHGHTLCPYWILQKELLAAGGYPRGTTSTTSPDAAGDIQRSYMQPPVTYGNYQWAEELVRTNHQQGWTMEINIHNTIRPEEGPNKILTVRALTFDQSHPFLPVQMEMTPRMSMPWFVEATQVQPIPEIETHASILRDITKGMQRVYSHKPQFDPQDWHTTTIVTNDGTAIRLGDNPDQNQLLHFWASWAPGNEERFREVQEIQKRFGKDMRLRIVSINLDGDKSAAAAVLKRIKPTWPQASFGADASRAEKFPFRLLPALVFAERQSSNKRVKDPDAFENHYRFHASDLFHREESSSPKTALECIEEILELQRRQKEAGGENLERIGTKGRDILRNATTAQLFRLFTPGRFLDPVTLPPVPGTLLTPAKPAGEEDLSDRDRKFDYQLVVEDELLGGYPIVWRGRDLSREEMTRVANVMLQEDSYIGSDPYKQDRSELNQSDDPFTKLGIRIQDGTTSFEFSWQDDIIRYPDARLYLTPAASSKLQDLLNPLIPRNAQSSGTIEAKMQEWKVPVRR